MARKLRGLILLVACAAAVAWLVFSIRSLVHSATDYHVTVLDPVRLGTTRPTTAEASSMEATQVRWGESTMFAVAAVALLLVLLFINTVLRGGESSRRFR